MNKNQIMARFRTPASIQLEELHKNRQLLSQQIKNIDKQIAKLLVEDDLETDKIADQLDRECPNWRKIIVDETGEELGTDLSEISRII